MVWGSQGVKGAGFKNAGKVAGKVEVGADAGGRLGTGHRGAGTRTLGLTT